MIDFRFSSDVILTSLSGYIIAYHRPTSFSCPYSKVRGTYMIKFWLMRKGMGASFGLILILFSFEVLGIEPISSGMLGKHSTLSHTHSPGVNLKRIRQALSDIKIEEATLSPKIKFKC